VSARKRNLAAPGLGPECARLLTLNVQRLSNRAKDASPSLRAEATIRKRSYNADVAWRSPAGRFTQWSSRNYR
jgi:hypothetical protein